MNRSDILKDIGERFKGEILEVFDKSPKRVYIEIKPQALVVIATYVFKNLGARFNIASGLDTHKHIEILYHFTFDEINFLISFRVKLLKNKLEIDSLAPIFEGANWIEREICEMLGVNFKGHPELKRLLLPDEWPQGVYPLRRDYKEWDDSSIRDRGL
ncbi:MAG: NADH-quinone oxidoreductase subunit C [Candidatus Omnitrophica bacterium]|nr:NADH-quinone oxidoreductase subunit C [Candidatus Omnitrophota bacterium]MBU2251048.1 NADH-quinone oxidoreductase subunit C [Candidatus Omnitrophota bacterium]MBU2266397.1 NADH-quinone oxidoreductase subunit C [Candidatus Omnitrophota bacterium]MBU2473600.1 NADH-quinone oxidoreductase subunit C [Candidatus Omnitrophota bacterium]